MARTHDVGSEQGSGAVPPGRRRDARLVLTGVAAVLFIWFAFSNLQDVTIHFWVTTTKAPLIVVILIAGALGAIMAALARRYRASHSRER